MIFKIKHRGLRAFWEKGEIGRLNANWIGRIDRIMNALDQAQTAGDVDFPGFRLHRLKGEYQGFYTVDVSGNWRIVFRFDGSDACDIDLIDYH